MKAVGHMYLVLDCRIMALRLLNVKQFACPSICKISDFLPDGRGDCICNEHFVDLVPYLVPDLVQECSYGVAIFDVF